jgi:hypothetical protein
VSTWPGRWGQRRPAAALLLAASASALAGQPPSRLPVLEIVNDDQARGEIAFTLDLPRGLPGDVLQLRDDDGQVVPVQVTIDRRISFVLPGLASGERRRLTIEPALDRRPRAVVEAIRRADRVELSVDQQLVAVYRGDGSLAPQPSATPGVRRGGYLHPVLTPHGRVVTDDGPPERPYDRGIWSAWAKTAFEGRHPDFWNMGDGTGAVQFESVLDTWSGPVQAGVRARHRFVDLGTAPPTTALTEDWEITLYALGRNRPAYRVFDLVSRQDTATSSALQVAEHVYGGIGVRGSREWRGAAGAQFLTSEGRTRRDANGSRPRWCYMGGTVGGRTAGLAVLDHPQNVRHPQPVRVHPLSPFLGSAPVQLGSLTIAPAQTYLARYRFVVLDGQPDAAVLDRLWKDFARPPAVTLVR